MEVQPTLEIDSIHSDANTEASASSPAPKDKRKKKKKASTDLLGLYSFDQAKQHRLDEEKALHKSSTFPATSSPRPIPVKFTKAFEYEDAHDFESSPSPPFPFSSSCPSRSALRGGHEGLGLGPRPKLHVRWAVDVRDPPETSISHTLRSNQRSSSSSSKKKQKKNKPKKSKSKRKTVINCVVPNEPPSGQLPHFCASDASETEDSVGLTIDENPVIPEPEASSDNPSWLSFLDVAMQHMLMASSFLAKENVAAALIEYKAAAHVFRLAKAGAETETSVEDQRSGVEQALRGQVLAWIAMATLYSASGQLSKGEKCHNLAVEACQDVGLTLSDLKSVHGFQNHFSSHCSLAASLSSDKSEKSSRTEII